MIPEIGLFSLILALLVALAQGILPLIGAATGWQPGLRLARPAAVGQFGLATVAFFCLAWSFVDNDFSVLYVAANSHADLPAGLPLAAMLARVRATVPGAYNSVGLNLYRGG